MLASVPFAVPKATVDYDERLSTIVNNRPRGMPVFCAAPAPTTPASRADRRRQSGPRREGGAGRRGRAWDGGGGEWGLGRPCQWWIIQFGNVCWSLLIPASVTFVSLSDKSWSSVSAARRTSPASVTFVPSSLNSRSRVSLARCARPASVTCVPSSASFRGGDPVPRGVPGRHP